MLFRLCWCEPIPTLDGNLRLCCLWADTNSQQSELLLCLALFLLQRWSDSVLDSPSTRAQTCKFNRFLRLVFNYANCLRLLRRSCAVSGFPFVSVVQRQSVLFNSDFALHAVSLTFHCPVLFLAREQVCALPGAVAVSGRHVCNGHVCRNHPHQQPMGNARLLSA